jgi:hypothetical protein
MKPYDLIHDNWDVLIDAAKYLVLSDMKFAIARMTFHVYKAYKVEIGSLVVAIVRDGCKFLLLLR